MTPATRALKWIYIALIGGFFAAYVAMIVWLCGLAAHVVKP